MMRKKKREKDKSMKMIFIKSFTEIKTTVFRILVCLWVLNSEVASRFVCAFKRRIHKNVLR